MMSIDRSQLTKQAEEYLASGNLIKAIESFLQLLEDNPKDLNLVNRVGDLYLQGKRQSEALAMFKRAADGYERDGFLSKSIAIYKKAFRTAPEDPELALCLIRVYKSANMLKDTIQAHIQLADIYARKGEVQKALHEFAEIVALEPRNIKNKIHLAELYDEEGLREKAAEIYLQAAEMLARDNRHPEANRLFDMVSSMTAVPKPVPIAIKAPASTPPIPAPSSQDTSSVDAEGLLDLPPGTEKSHDDSKAAEKAKTAEELYNTFRDKIAKQVSGDDYDTHYNLGIAYKEMMLTEPAIEEFKMAMADPERMLECCSMLALCEEMKGDLDAATAWLKKGIDDPGFPPVDSVGLRYDLAKLLERMGRLDESEALFKEVQALTLAPALVIRHN